MQTPVRRLDIVSASMVRCRLVKLALADVRLTYLNIV